MKKSVQSVLIPLAALIGLALTVTAVVFFIPRDNTSFSLECFRLRSAVSGFLKDVENERYDDAFETVYCTSAEDGRVLEATDACREAWTERVSALRNGTDGTYLKDFSDLSVRKENGEFIVTVTLSVIRQGYNDPFYADGSTFTVVYQDGWKISSLSGYETELQTDLEKALSGRFTSDELAGEAS